MHRSRTNYWSNSKVADLIRGEPLPSSLSSEGWNIWKNRMETTNKIRYFLSESLDSLQNVVMYPVDLFETFRYYIRCRFFDKRHMLKSKLKPGEYYELDTRILHALFDSLVDFVEQDKAWMQWISSKDTTKMRKPGYFARTFGRWRDPVAGVKYLYWECSLTKDWLDSNDPERNDPSDQAIAAKEILELYEWWIRRASRPDPYDLSGWSDLVKNKSLLDFSGGVVDESERSMLNALSAIESSYEAEDEAMLIRLIKIRQRLWT